jgi:hypothetical protein
LIIVEDAMYLQEILEVAIGLVFIWLVSSIATMSLQEWISNIINLRAKDLKKAIAQMLSSKDLTRRFYEYPLIASLYPQPKRRNKKPHLPSYIPANKFSAALFELIIQAGMDNSPVQAMTDEIEKQLASSVSPEQQTLARGDWDAILEIAKNVTASGLGVAALDSLKFQVQAYGEKYPEVKLKLDMLIPQLDTYYGQFVKEQRAATESGPDTGLAMRQFRLGMLALQKTNPRLNKSVTAVIRQAEVYALGGKQAVAATRVNLETWFNDVMDRLSGTYKQRAQLISFIIGFILALLLNVDSIRVATSLWREPILRQAIVAQAQSYASSVTSQADPTTGPLENIQALETQLQALNIPLGWTTASFNTGGSRCSLLPFQAGHVWGIPSWDNQGHSICKRLNNLPTDSYGWLVKVLGMLMTGAAAAQGAPFWFDILKKLVNVRGTGINPDEQNPVG